MTTILERLQNHRARLDDLTVDLSLIGHAYLRRKARRGTLRPAERALLREFRGALRNCGVWSLTLERHNGRIEEAQQRGDIETVNRLIEQ